MSRTTSVHFSPPVGCRINLVNNKTGDVLVASTLSIRDKTPFKHRTPKGTPKGQEYFYVKLRNENKWVFVKMLNSLLLPNCVSEDGSYSFMGDLPNGGSLQGGEKKVLTRVKVEKVETNKTDIKFFTNSNLLNSI